MIADIIKDTETRMRKAMDALHHNLDSVRTGRASPALVDRIHVDYYGTSTPLNQLAGISTPEARMIVIQPWDRGSIGPIEKAILQSDLGLNPNNDGQVIRLNIPTLTVANHVPPSGSPKCQHPSSLLSLCSLATSVTTTTTTCSCVTASAASFSGRTET